MQIRHLDGRRVRMTLMSKGEQYEGIASSIVIIEEYRELQNCYLQAREDALPHHQLVTRFRQ